MRLVLVCVAAVLLLSGAFLFFKPHLASEDYKWSPVERATRSMSDSAVAGLTAFGQNCAGCHGELATGGSGPALTGRSYAIDFRDSPRFHAAFSVEIPAHRDVIRAAKGEGRLSFNELELMSKFLREARIYHQRKRQLDAELGWGG